MSSGFVKTISEGDVGTFVRYDADDLRACQENHQRMLEHTGQTEEQHREAMSNVFESQRKKQMLLKEHYFKGAAKQFPVERQARTVVSPHRIKAAAKFEQAKKRKK